MPRKTSTVEVYAVEVTRPAGVSIEDMRMYIYEAVKHWCRGVSAENPVFDIGDYAVLVRRVPGTQAVRDVQGRPR